LLLLISILKLANSAGCAMLLPEDNDSNQSAKFS